MRTTFLVLALTLAISPIASAQLLSDIPLTATSDTAVSLEDCKNIQVHEDSEIGHKVTELPQGCPAPFSGQLLNPKLAAELQQDVETKEKEIDLAVKTTEKLWKAELGYRLKLSAADLEAERLKHAITQEALDRATAWYRQPWFIITVTVVGIAAVTSGTALLHGQVNR